ncbi:hypothetical protein H0H92_002639 [Tricholoma furcatifolium]|nr:hypothetical protein H0H92_002639 [Tricholoma furcatifolium]
MLKERYRQGMHEVLASLYYAVDFDSLPPDGSTGGADVQEVCSRTWVAADACTLFDSVMRGLSRWYEWREPLPSTSRHFVPPFATQLDFKVPDGPLDTKPYIAPIVEVCNRIQSTYLRTTDPLLYRHMQSAGIEPQIYGIRWLRLLFTREFNMADSMKLWDGLFACDPTLDLAPWVCVAMLIRIRNECKNFLCSDEDLDTEKTTVIPADYSGQLTALLRYPSPRSPPSFEDAPHPSSLLLRQALALQMSPTPSTGASIILENRNMLNIPVEVPSQTPAPQHRRTPNRNASPSQGRVTPPIQGHSRQTTTPQMGISEMITRGIMERGESLGINKSLMNAVSELRRNIPDLAASLVRAPNASTSMFPLSDERPPEERPPWEPRSRFEMERESSSLRATNKRLGEALVWIVDALLQDETEVKEPQRLKKQRQEALESLSYVRDVLLGNVDEIEEERLLGEEDFLKRNSSKARTNQAPPPPRLEALAPPPAAAHPHPQAQPLRNATSPDAMISPSTFGSGRIAGTPSSGLNGLPPWNESQSRLSSSHSSVGTEGVPWAASGAGQKKGNGIEDPLGVGLA